MSPEITALHSVWQERNNDPLCSLHPWNRAGKLRKTRNSSSLEDRSKVSGELLSQFCLIIWTVDNEDAKAMHSAVIIHHSRFKRDDKFGLITTSRRGTVINFLTLKLKTFSSHSHKWINIRAAWKTEVLKMRANNVLWLKPIVCWHCWNSLKILSSNRLLSLSCQQQSVMSGYTPHVCVHHPSDTPSHRDTNCMVSCVVFLHTLLRHTLRFPPKISEHF